MRLQFTAKEQAVRLQFTAKEQVVRLQFTAKEQAVRLQFTAKEQVVRLQFTAKEQAVRLCRKDTAWAVANRLGGLVVKASASRAEDPGFESHMRRDFSGSSHTSD